jgi:hypothetical protein
MSNLEWGKATAGRVSSIVALAACAVLSATAAQARYTAVDASGNTPIRVYLGGYCDGSSECGYDSTYIMPYTVNFGGLKTDRIRLLSNGRLQFVDNTLTVLREINTGISDGPEIYASNQGVRYAFPGAPPPQQLFPCPINVACFTFSLKQFASSGDAHALATQDATPDKFGIQPPFLNPVVDYTLKSDIIKFSWFTCFSPNACLQDVHSVTLTPNADGFAVVYGGINSGKAGEELRAGFGNGVPEPSAWALLILGFASVGAALRVRRGRRPRFA